MKADHCWVAFGVMGGGCVQTASSASSCRVSLRSQVCLLSRRVSAGQYELVRLIAELDDSGEWAFENAATCAHWVADACDVKVCTAPEWLRIGHALHRLPFTDAAAQDGALSHSKLRELTRVATVDNEEELVKIACRVPADRLAAALAAWINRHEEPAQTQHGTTKPAASSGAGVPMAWSARWSYSRPRKPANSPPLSTAKSCAREPHPRASTSTSTWT